MINGNPIEFVDHIYYGDEMVFLFHNKKYFLQGWHDGKLHTLCLETWEPPSDDYLWYEENEDPQILVDHFLDAPLFDNKKFWDAEGQMEWIDD